MATAVTRTMRSDRCLRGSNGNRLLILTMNWVLHMASDDASVLPPNQPPVTSSTSHETHGSESEDEEDLEIQREEIDLKLRRLEVRKKLKAMQKRRVGHE
jgi:hypothetical protein